MKKLSLGFIAFLQALGLATYITLVGLFIWNAEHLVGKINNPLGPILFLAIFVLSAIICALVTLSYPVILFWDKKETSKAIKLAIYTGLWMAIFTIVLVMLLAIL